MKDYTEKELEIFLRRNPEAAVKLAVELRRKLTVERMISDSYEGRMKLFAFACGQKQQEINDLRKELNHENS